MPKSKTETIAKIKIKKLPTGNYAFEVVVNADIPTPLFKSIVLKALAKYVEENSKMLNNG